MWNKSPWYITHREVYITDVNVLDCRLCPGYSVKYCYLKTNIFQKTGTSIFLYCIAIKNKVQSKIARSVCFYAANNLQVQLFKLCNGRYLFFISISDYESSQALNIIPLFPLIPKLFNFFKFKKFSVLPTPDNNFARANTFINTSSFCSVIILKLTL